MINEPEFKTRRAPGRDPVRILLLEDDPHFTDLIETQLRRMLGVAARIEAVHTLAAALERLRAERFGLVMTDLNLPDARGLEAVQALSRAGEQLVIVLTRDQNPALRAGAIECGAYDFLPKDNLSAAALERIVRLAAIQAHTFAALRDSEARLRSLINLSSDFFWESDREHRVVKIEHGSSRHPAASPSQLGKPRWETPSIHPDAEGWAAHRATLDAHQPFRDFEIARLDEDGVVRWRSISGEPVFDAGGLFRGYRGIGKDVSERKHRDEELRRFRHALDTSPDLILIIDRASMRMVDVNSTACRLLGYSREELLERGPQDVLPLSREELERAYDRMIDDPASVTGMRSYYRCRDGSRLPFESTRRVLRSGERWLIAAISRDMRSHIAADEALRESEARFRSLTALSSDWFWETDAEHRFVSTARRAIELSGYQAAAYLGKRRWEVEGLSPVEGDWSPHWRVLERRETFRDFELLQRRADGGRVYLQVSGEPVYHPDGAFKGYRGTVRDISERKRKEAETAQLGRMYRALSAANEAILRATSPQEMFQRACDIAVEAGGFLIGTVFVVEREGGRLSRVAASGAAAALVKDIVPEIDDAAPGGGGVLGRAYRTGASAVSNDYANDPVSAARRGLVRSYQVGAAAAFPLLVEGRVEGLFGLQHAARHAFSDELTGLLQRLADNISFALETFRRDRRRVQAEAALQQSEAWFRQTFELAGSGIAHVAMDGRFLRVNRRLCEILGYAQAELVGESVKTISHPDDRDATDAQRARMHAGELESVRVEKRYLRRDGSAVWVDLTVALARDASGAPLYEISILEDITQQKAAEAALRESEARFRSLTDLSADFYWESDAQHRVVRTTHGLNHRPINAKGGQIGKARWDIASTRPDAAGWAAHRALLDAHRPFREFELARLDEEGHERHLSISGEPVFDAAGAFIGYRGVGKEITARKRDEALLQLEHDVTRYLAQAENAGAGLRAVIEAVCRAHGWPCGRYFAADAEKDVLRFAEAWGHSTPEVAAFLARSRGTVYRRGEGLSGSAWESGEPIWVRDVSKDRRASGSRSALRGGAFVFPVISGDRTMGVLSFSSPDVREPDARLLQAARVIASQVGQFLQRKQAEEVLRDSEARFRSLTSLSSDWYWEQDAQLRFTKFEGRGAGDYDPARAVLGKRFWELEGVVRESLDGDAHRARLERHEPFRDLEYEYRDRAGRRFFIRVDGEPVFDASGAFAGYRGTSRDITQQRRGEEELRRFRAAMDMSHDAIYLTDRAAMRFVDVNKVACKSLGYTREQLLTMGPHEVLSTPREQLEREYDAVIAEGSNAVRVETTYVTRDGRTGWSELLRRALRSGDGWTIVTISRDITERKRAEQRQAAHLRYQERVARFGQAALVKSEPAELIDKAVQAVLEALGADAVAYLEGEPGIGAVVLRAVVGAAEASAAPGPVACRPGDPVAQTLASGARQLAAGAALPLPWARGMGSAALIPVRGDAKVRGVLCACYREPEAFGPEELNFIEAAASVLSTALQRIDSEGRLAYLAQFDPLTGLPNRTLLADRFSQMIVQAKRRNSPLGVLFIDLDGFKLVNDTLGHAGGDALLKEAALRLQATVRSGDTVARISGDEFAIVLGDLARPEDAALVAQKVLDRVSAAFDVHGNEVFVTASVGIAGFPGDGAEAESLIGAADAAMYRAKQSGRNTYQFFTAEINQRSRARAQLGSELRRALEREEFMLAYQPKVDLVGRRASGAEALLRWKHPERGNVSPAEFIAVLEETGLIVPVGEWVIRRACDDVKRWQAAGLRVVPVSVNLSARQFRQQDLDARVKALVDAAGVDPGLIELEITESQLMTDPDHAIRVMRALCGAGMGIAIDDFGTGYSSLSYLTRFPVGALKVDRSFVKDMTTDRSAATIVRTIIEMAHSLGFSVVAEGVETEEQADLLRQLGCEYAQGYLFARPMPADELARLPWL